MSKTHRHPTYERGIEQGTWGRAGRGKSFKRAYHKAVRRAFKGTGKARSVAGYSSELKYKGA